MHGKVNAVHSCHSYNSCPNCKKHININEDSYDIISGKESRKFIYSKTSKFSKLINVRTMSSRVLDYNAEFKRSCPSRKSPNMYTRLGKMGSLWHWSRVMVCCSKLCF
jgi:hypothetical protein